MGPRDCQNGHVIIDEDDKTGLLKTAANWLDENLTVSRDEIKV